MRAYLYCIQAGWKNGQQRAAWLATIWIVAGLLFLPAMAQPPGPIPPLQGSLLTTIFPGAIQASAMTGSPPAAEVQVEGGFGGYIFSTWSVIHSTGYSGAPIDILVGLSRDGRITGAVLRQHTEPILVIGISDADLKAFVAQFSGLSIRGKISRKASETAGRLPDAISGATVSSAVIGDAILTSARLVAESRRMFEATPTVAPEIPEVKSWQDFIASGAIGHMRLSRGEVAARRGEKIDHDEEEDEHEDDPFIDLYAGVVTPHAIGSPMIGAQTYNKLRAEMAAGDQLFAILAKGLYSYKGTRYVRSGVFDRISLVQGALTIPFTRDRYVLIENLAFPDDDIPEFREIGLFILPADSGFDGSLPWRLDLRVDADDANPVVFSLAHTPQASSVIKPAPEPAPEAAPKSAPVQTTPTLQPKISSQPQAQITIQPPPPAQLQAEAQLPTTISIEPLWKRAWTTSVPEIIFLTLMLTTLTGILLFQDFIVRKTHAYLIARNIFLTVTLVWLGYIAGGQLSVVNVLTFVHAMRQDFRWEYFLVSPIIFILWGYVAVAMLFWGRGVYCGWLCPFGAMQELLNEVARRLKVPQIRVPFGLHERLWPIKYVIFLGLFAISLYSMELAVVASEVEPFKTAIVLKFVRGWPFLFYVVAILVAGLFIERFFCRYFCPLGAALAIPSRLHMFDWLKRRRQCGTECSICAQHCTVQAVHPNGAINPNECVQCLKCQTLYYDDHTCPPLIASRKRAEKLRASGSLIAEKLSEGKK